MSMTLPGSVQQGWGYDGDGRLITQTLAGPTGVTAPLSSTYGYSYTATGWTNGVTSTLSGITTTQLITHDAQGRLTAASGGGTSQSWRYDGNGNLLSAVITTTGGTTTTSYGYTQAISPNEVLIVTTPGQPTTYCGYDAHGDTTSITNGNSLNTAIQYDSEARPITITLADGTQVTLGYNADGLRASYSVRKGGLTTLSEHFQYRAGELAQAIVVSGTQAYTDTYVFAPSGAPLELLRTTSTGTTTRYWYQVDGRGNVAALTDSSGSVVDRYSYDLWGYPTSVSESVPQHLRYGGYWWDAALGWYWVSVRYYDSALMRWVQPDPSEQDGMHTYAYVDNNAIDETDPSGLFGFLPQGWMGFIDQCPYFDPEPEEIVYTPLDTSYVPLGPTRPIRYATNPEFRAIGLCAGFGPNTAPVLNDISEYTPDGAPRIARGCASDSPRYGQCQRSHMVAASLGGPGIRQNILYTTRRANTHGFGTIEREIKDLIGRGYIVYYRVYAHYATIHSWAPDHIYVLVTRVNKEPVEGYGGQTTYAEECADAFARIDNNVAGDITNLPLPPNSARCVGDIYLPTD